MESKVKVARGWSENFTNSSTSLKKKKGGRLEVKNVTCSYFSFDFCSQFVYNINL